jgi:hypothetical protein
MRTLLQPNCQQGSHKRTDPNPSLPVIVVLIALVAVTEAEQLQLIATEGMAILASFVAISIHQVEMQLIYLN